MSKSAGALHEVGGDPLFILCLGGSTVEHQRLRLGTDTKHMRLVFIFNIDTISNLNELG